MKVLVMGSKRHLSKSQDMNALSGSIEDAARQIGKVLVERGHTVWVGSTEKEDVDPFVIEGACSAAGMAAKVEVHICQDFVLPALNDQEKKCVKIVQHQFPDWDATVMETVRDADAVVCIGGRVGVVHAGINAWMMGKPIIPVGSFNGGAKKVWEYGSRRRDVFFHDALNDQAIDRLIGSWDPGGASATFVVESLERTAKRASIEKVPKRLFYGVLALLLGALAGWVGLLTLPFIFDAIFSKHWNTSLNFFMMFATIGVAGLFGSSMLSVRRLQNGVKVNLRSVIVDVVLGCATGVVSAALYLLAQVAVNGQIASSLSNNDYVRVTLFVSLVALFGGLFIDRAFARFEMVSENVLAGKFTND